MDFLPDDPADDLLRARVAPASWPAPTPADRYNLVVVGGGTAGLVAAIGGARLGARVALVEGGAMGGDCLVWGCVPSKALIRAARAAHDARGAEAFGVHVGDVQVDSRAALARMRALRADIGVDDSFERVRDEGVDVFRGWARFVGPDRVEVGGQTLRFARAVIATGAGPAMPDIEGLSEIEPWTNESLFQQRELPERLLVLGGGPIGCELAQACARLGTEVTLVQRGPRLLPRDDPAASSIVAQAMARDGVRVALQTTLARVERVGTEVRAVLQDHDGATEAVTVDAVLVAVGRQPNTGSLGLGAAGVEVDARGAVVVGDTLRTHNQRIYASGDVVGSWAFTHAADAMSRVVLRNALFFGWQRASRLVIPWTTYTDPEVAHVGCSAEEAARLGATAHTTALTHNHRAVLDGETEGFTKVYASASGRVLGGTVVARNAGDHIAQLSLAVTRRLHMNDLVATVYPYPTQGEALRQAADAWRGTQLTPSRLGWLRRLMALRR